MADPRFFVLAGPFALRELAGFADAEIAGERDPDQVFSDVAPLDQATARDVSFLHNKRYLDQLAASRAGVCIISPDYADRAPEGMALLLTPKPHRGYALVAQAFYPPIPHAEGVHPTAVVDPSARIGEGTAIGPRAVIGAGAEIGRGCVIKANAVIEDGVTVGDGTEIGANAFLTHCLIGRNCLIHAGVCIGNRGFGFSMDPEGFVDVPQLGRVIVEDGVEVGANSTIDRGAGPDTVIGAGTKIDNLVQIGHNVHMGRGCVLVAQAGVAGSAKLEDYVVLGPQSGVAGHLKVGKGAQLSAQCGVIRDVPPGQVMAGSPGMPIKDVFRLVSIWKSQVKARGRKGNE